MNTRQARQQPQKLIKHLSVTTEKGWNVHLTFLLIASIQTF